MCPFGGIISGFLLESLGRKRTLITINLVSIVSWLLLAFASKTDRTLMFVQLIVARIIIGI